MRGRTTGTCAALAALLVITTAPAAGQAAGQQDDQDWLRRCEEQVQRADRAVACQVRPMTTSLAAGALDVDAGINGGISVAGATASTAADVQLSARIQAYAATDARARELADAIRIDAGPGRIRADGPATGNGEGWTVSYRVVVPQRADLELQARNGPIAVRDVAGRIRATTMNGPVVLENLGGDVRARAQNGPLTVRLAGSRWDGAGLDAETRNGPVALHVPDGYSAELEMGTVNGPMNTSIPLMVSGRIRGGPMRTTLGSGGAPIRVVTTNGPVSVNRR
jgi:hypothetical protein